MKTKGFYNLILLFSFFLFISCGGGKENLKGNTNLLNNKATVKIGNFQWFFNFQGLNGAIEEAKKTDRLIFAVFSSKW